MSLLTSQNTSNTKRETKEDNKNTEYISPEEKWILEVKKIRDKLNIEDLIFLNHVTCEVEVIPNKLWITFKSIDNDILSNIVAQAARDTSGEPIVVYENHFAVLTLVESILSIRTNKGEKALPKTKEGLYSELQSYNYNLLRKIKDKYNQFDSAINMLLTNSDPDYNIGDELKK